MGDFDAGIAQDYQEGLRRDVHVPGERQQHEEGAEEGRVGPPGRQDVVGIGQEVAEEPIHRAGEETSSGNTGGEALGQQPDRENGPQAVHGPGKSPSGRRRTTL